MNAEPHGITIQLLAARVETIQPHQLLILSSDLTPTAVLLRILIHVSTSPHMSATGGCHRWVTDHKPGPRAWPTQAVTRPLDVRSQVAFNESDHMQDS